MSEASLSETPLNPSTPSTRIGRLVDWFKSRERSLLLITAAAQVVVLVGMIASRSIPYFRGQTVLLKVQPVDPRDMFRGDYVILGYEFSRLPPAAIPELTTEGSRNESARMQGRTIFVSLVPESDGIHYRGNGFSLTPPASGLYLRGTLGGGNRIEFGIDSYYVQEGTGHKYEQAVRDHRLWAEVAVTPDGQAALKGLKIE